MHVSVWKQGMGTNAVARCCPSMQLDGHQGVGDKTGLAVNVAEQPCNLITAVMDALIQTAYYGSTLKKEAVDASACVYI